MYKITKQSKKYTLMYALNPLILFEGLSNVHNEMLVIFLILGAIYFLITKKKILPAIGLLACATAVKYFAILLAPFFVLYYYQKEALAKKIVYSVFWAVVFLSIMGLWYAMYMQDIQILRGIFTQQNKYANSIFLGIILYKPKAAEIIAQACMVAYVAIYLCEILKILTIKQEYTWEQMMLIYNRLLLLFIFGVITNLQPWYITWILPTIFWQKKEMMKRLAITNYYGSISNKCIFFI